MTLGLKFLFWKNSDMHFQLQLCILAIEIVFCMGKGAYIKRMVAVRNYSTNTIMEKNKQWEG